MGSKFKEKRRVLFSIFEYYCIAVVYEIPVIALYSLLYNVNTTKLNMLYENTFNFTILLCVCVYV